MQKLRFSLQAVSGIAVASTAIVMAAPAVAQDAGMSQQDIQSLPVEYQTAPKVSETTETSVGVDGVETITRTRRIEYRGPATSSVGGAYHVPEPQTTATGYAPVQYAPAYATYSYAPGASVLERDQWIAECERRVQGRERKEKRGINGGVVGNRVADGDRLLGTIVGGGIGGLAGAAIGGAFDGDEGEYRDYDCEAALDSYLSNYSIQQPARIASRVIAAPVQSYGYTYPAYAPGYYDYGYAPAYHSYSYAPPAQVVMVPITYEQQQRVVVRETVREEMVQTGGGATRIIDEEVTSEPVSIKRTRKDSSRPRSSGPSKYIK